MNGPYSHEEYLKHADSIKVSAKKWRDANPEKCRAQREKNKDKRKADFERWLESHSDTNPSASI